MASQGLRDIRLGCVIMASGTGSRFAAALGEGGRWGDTASGDGGDTASGNGSDGGASAPNKLFEPLGSSSVLGLAIDSVPPDYQAIVSTRWPGAAMIAADKGVDFVLHDGSLRSDSVRAGLQAGKGRDWQGCLFLPGDQPLVSRESFEQLADAFRRDPRYIYRLGWHGHPGSPVLFPRRCFDALMHLEGGDGGSAVIRAEELPVKAVDAVREIELLDIDVPEDLCAARAHLGGAVVSKQGTPDQEW